MIDDVGIAVTSVPREEVCLEKKCIFTGKICVGSCVREEESSGAPRSNCLSNTNSLMPRNGELSNSCAYTVEDMESSSGPVSGDCVCRLETEKNNEEEMSHMVFCFCESKWWWRQECDLKPNATESSRELSPADMKAELFSLYDLFDSSRACLMRGEISGALYDPAIAPNDNNLEEAVRRGLSFVVILRFTLWFYLIETGYLCPACLAVHSELASTESADSGENVCPIPSPALFGGVDVDRGDWLELLSLFAPHDWAPVIRQRALSNGLSGASALCSRAGTTGLVPLVFSPRRSAGMAATAPAVEFDVQVAALRGTNSARHGIVHPSAAFRKPPTETQWFLFHGEFHILNHADGLARCASHRYLSSDTIGPQKAYSEVFHSVMDCTTDIDAHDIVEYAEALLLPPCSSSTCLPVQTLKSPHTSTIPPTLMPVCAGAFCFPRELADGNGAEELALWGFYNKEGEHINEEHMTRSSEALYAAVTGEMPTDVFVTRMCDEVLLRDTSVLTSGEGDSEGSWFANASKSGEALFSNFAMMSNALVSPLPSRPIAAPIMQTFSDVLTSSVEL